MYASAPSGRQPVMVWIHGGGFLLGSARNYDGASLVRRGDVVVVTVNYRLGILGFAALDHLDDDYAGAANNGIRDQICALEWVRDNIESFGGDPGNVTIFGQSAGGESVAALLASPAAAGLHHRAIIQSATVEVPPLGDRQRAVTDRALAQLGGAGDLERLLTATTAELLDAQHALASPQATTPRVARPEHVDIFPSVDGEVLTRTPIDAVRSNGSRGVPLIVGTTRHEGTIFADMAGAAEHCDEAAVRRAFEAHGLDADRVWNAYRTFRVGATPREILIDSITESLVRIGSLGLAEAAVDAGPGAWVYLFTWESDADGGRLGAAHGLDVPFLWDWLDQPRVRDRLGTPPWPAHLTAVFQERFAAFARAGDPTPEGHTAWPRYDARTRPTLVLDHHVDVVPDPDGATRSIWM